MNKPLFVCNTIDRPHDLERLISSAEAEGVDLLICHEYGFRIAAQRYTDLFAIGVLHGYDAIGWIADDCEFRPGFLNGLYNEIASAEDCAENIPVYSDCWVLGLNQANLPKGSKKAFPVVSLPLIKYFRERLLAVGCPDYNHFFVDDEMCEFAEKHPQAQFWFAEEAEINHHHRGAVKGMKPDDTHRLLRQNSSSDKATRSKRTSLGYLWGMDLRLVNDDRQPYGFHDWADKSTELDLQWVTN